MNMFAYSVFDTKSLIYHLPFFQPTDGAAIRMLADLVNDPNTQMGRHPADFVLYCVGTYDGNVGGLQSSLPLRHIIDAAALVRKQAELPFSGFAVDPKLTTEQLEKQLSNGDAK